MLFTVADGRVGNAVINTAFSIICYLCSAIKKKVQRLIKKMFVITEKFEDSFICSPCKDLDF